ncbi:MAG: hypothetical protein SNJ56_04755 [Termitinemataceae bacterium]
MCNLSPWYWFGPDAASDCVIYSRLSLYRSSSKFLFPGRSSQEELESFKLQFLNVLHNLASPDSSTEEPHILVVTEQTDLSCMLALQEIFDIQFDSPLQLEQALVALPNGLVFQVNRDSHLLISRTCPGLQALHCTDDVIQWDRQLDAQFQWACSIQHGFLNPTATHTGSGMEFSALLYIPGIMISNMFERVSKGLLAQGFEISVYQENTEAEASLDDSEEKETEQLPLVNVRYAFPPDLSETAGLDLLRTSLGELIQGERATRERLLPTFSEELADRSYRALAVLSAARLLDHDEFRTLYADLRKGLVFTCGPMPNSNIQRSQLDTLWFTLESRVREALQRSRTAQGSKIEELLGSSGLSHEADEKLRKRIRAELVRSSLAQYHIDRGM